MVCIRDWEIDGMSAAAARCAARFHKSCAFSAQEALEKAWDSELIESLRASVSWHEARARVAEARIAAAEEEERKASSSTITSCCGSCHGTQGCFECPERN